MQLNLQTFVIKSLYVQNTIMLLFLGAVIFLLLQGLIKKKAKQTIVFSVWVFIVIGFFNSPFFGFSVVSVAPEGIHLKYGILSFRNTVIPLNSSWKIETHLSGVKKMRRLYLLNIAERRSMKVRGKKGENLLQEIAKAIEERKVEMEGSLKEKTIDNI